MNQERYQLPSNPEAERSLICRVITEGRVAFQHAAEMQVNSSDFLEPSYIRLFQAAAELYAKGTDWDASTLYIQFAGTPLGDEVNAITDYNSGNFSTRELAQKVKEVGIKRELIPRLKDAIRSLSNPRIEWSEFQEAEWDQISRLATMKQSAKEKPSLPLLGIEDALAYEIPPDASLIGRSYLERGQITLFVGVGGLGKSRFVAQFGMQMACGRTSFLGFAIQPARVLYLCSENGLARWKMDARIVTQFTPEERQRLKTEFKFLDISKGDASIYLPDKFAQDLIAETVRKYQPDLVVFDPWGDCVEEENDTASMQESIRLVRRAVNLPAPQAAIALVHHARTGMDNLASVGNNFAGGSFARGSKALTSKARCEWDIAPGDKEDSSKLVVACGKINNDAKFPPFGVILNQDNGLYQLDYEFDYATWMAEIKGKKATGGQVEKCSVAEVVTKLPPYVVAGRIRIADAARGIAAQMQVAEKTVRRRIEEAIGNGALTRHDSRFISIR